MSFKFAGYGVKDLFIHIPRDVMLGLVTHYVQKACDLYPGVDFF